MELEENGRVRVSRAVVRVLFAGPYRPFEIVSTDGPTPPYTHVLEKETKQKNISSPLRQKQPPLKHDISFSTKSEKKKKKTCNRSVPIFFPIARTTIFLDICAKKRFHHKDKKDNNSYLSFGQTVKVDLVPPSLRFGRWSD